MCVETHGLNSKILAASFKNTEQVHALISAGIDAQSLSTRYCLHMDHPGTKIAMRVFAAWRRFTVGIRLTKSSNENAFLLS